MKQLQHIDLSNNAIIEFHNFDHPIQAYLSGNCDGHTYLHLKRMANTNNIPCQVLNHVEALA
jgi:hypothetical protein